MVIVTTITTFFFVTITVTVTLIASTLIATDTVTAGFTVIAITNCRLYSIGYGNNNILTKISSLIFLSLY